MSKTSASREADRGREHTLYGYVAERGEGRSVAVLLRPNLVAEGRTPGEAKHRLGQLLHAYDCEAAADGQIDHFMSLRAPARFYVEYFGARFLHFINHSLKPFHMTYCVPQRA